MMLKIAFRNIFRQKRRTILTALAMIVGFTLSSIVIGLSDGAYSNVIDMFTGNRIGHIQVHRAGYHDKPTLYNTISDYESIGKTIQNEVGVKAWTPRVYTGGLGSVNEKSTAVRIIGIDVARENIATHFNKKVIEGNTLSENASHEIVIGEKLAKTLAATIGSKIVLFSQAADGSIANDAYTIVGIADSGDEITNRIACYLHIDDVQELFVLEGRVHEIVVIVSNINKVESISNAIKETLDDTSLEILPWYQVVKSFYDAMQKDKQGDAVARFIIVFIVAVGVLNTVLMSVMERTREYGVLKAVGTKPIQVFWLVIYEVVIISVGSIVIGAMLGVFFNYLLSVYGVSYAEGFTMAGVEFGKMYAEVNVACLMIPATTVFLSAVIVSLYPAIKAARIIPARAMRIH